MPLPNHVILRLLRVSVRIGGTLLFAHREGALPPADESWWQDVLRDPRASVPTQHYIDRDDLRYAHYRLDRQRADFLVRCPCGREEWINRDTLTPQVGADMNVVYLVREWMPCRERNKMANWCRAYVVR